MLVLNSSDRKYWPRFHTKELWWWKRAVVRYRQTCPHTRRISKEGWHSYARIRSRKIIASYWCESSIFSCGRWPWCSALLKQPPLSDATTTRSLIRENESADILVKKGYNVEQNPVIDGVKNPDYRIDGVIYDNYAPETSNVRNICVIGRGKSSKRSNK